MVASMVGLPRKQFDTIIVGAGPAGTGPLIAAAQQGTASLWLNRGILWASQQATMGAGSLSKYAIASDTAAKVLLEALQGQNNPLADLIEQPLSRQLAQLGDQAVPLNVAAQYLAMVGERLRFMIAQAPASDFWPNSRATGLRRLRDGSFVVRFADGREAQSRQVVLALGGYQDRVAALDASILTDLTLRHTAADKVWLSGDLFCHGGMAHARVMLTGVQRPPRVVILGGSHSALCAADALLASSAGQTFAAGGIEIWCRKIPKPFYPSVIAAHTDGFFDFRPDDVCPVTGRVFRLAGLRMASRQLLRAILGLGGEPTERRVRIRQLDAAAEGELRASLRHADMVLPCFGYKPHGISFVDEARPQRKLSAGDSFERPRVDGSLRILDHLGEPIAGAYGIGLATGFVPRGPNLGGEPSFRGQTNGIWLYQHDLGHMLLTALHAPVGEPQAIQHSAAVHARG